MITATELSQELGAIADRLRQFTVKVKERRGGVGSGVIWNADGVIITNAHVVRGSHTEIELFDGQVLSATVTNRNNLRDLVALKIPASNLTTATIGDSDAIRTGELVMAIGNPLGITGAITTGIIHNSGDKSFTHRNWIQADIALAPGNSGGPLINAQGQVIGINTMIVNGKGFAVPSNVVQQFLQSQHDRPYLGVSLQLVRLGRRRGFGYLITEVELDSPAASAQLQPGDLLIGVRGSRFQTPNELFYILENSNSGDGLMLDVIRGDRSIVVDVVLWGKNSQTQAA